MTQGGVGHARAWLSLSNMKADSAFGVICASSIGLLTAWTTGDYARPGAVLFFVISWIVAFYVFRFLWTVMDNSEVIVDRILAALRSLIGPS